jgi:hypothetical protein
MNEAMKRFLIGPPANEPVAVSRFFGREFVWTWKRVAIASQLVFAGYLFLEWYNQIADERMVAEIDEILSDDEEDTTNNKETSNA